MRFVRCTVDFSAYTKFKLHPLKDVELPEPEPDGFPNFSAFTAFSIAQEKDWKVREGGVLYVVGDMSGDFFCCISNYNMGGLGRAGIFNDEWNTLFPALQNAGYPKNIIPCMVSV